MNKDEVFCPDCLKNFISIEKFNKGDICTSCNHRKIWSLNIR